MEELRIFLESSTIHGLTYISTTRKYVKLFWILVVFGGFTGAGMLIYASFEAWNESPIKTTIETVSIKEITFPKVTVCPPKHVYTSLNYDLVMKKNMTLSDETRNNLTRYAIDLLNDHLLEKIMKNLNKFEEKDRYHNWYYGFSEIVNSTYLISITLVN